VTCDKPSGSSFNVGTTPIQCTATDDANNRASCSFDITVTSNTVACSLTAPTSPIVADSRANECGTNVTFTVDSTGTCGTVTCDHPSGSFFGIGNTAVTCKSTTGGASTSFTVTVNDVTVPVPSVATLPTVTGTCAVTVEAPTASDNCGGVIAGNTSDPRTYDAPGTYVVHWTYSDNSGNSTAQDQTVIVHTDTTAPVPDMAILPTVTGECSATVAATPTATDNCSGTDIAGRTTDPLSYTGAGTYTVRWSYTDAAGNSSNQSQTVVVTDSVAPTIALVGPASVTIECHDSFTDEGVTTADNCVPKNVTVATSGSVDANKPGTYTLTYTATDGGGNHATAERTVTVVDATPPTLTLNGASSMTVECHGSFTDPGATASDSCDSDVPVTVSGSVSAGTPGTYSLTYSAVDDSGNAAPQVTRTVTVVDTTPPVIALNGGTSLNVECHTSFTDPGAAASDGCDSNVRVNATGSVNVNIPGTYTVSYNAVDASGNAAVQVTRTVIVRDTIPPTITLNGSSSVTVECHTSFTDPGATASDSCDSSVPVTVAGSVNVNTPGTYTLTYNGSDDSGNAAAAVTRTVTVVDTTPPTLTLNNLTIFFNNLTVVFNANTVTFNGVTYPFNGVSCTHEGYTFSFNGQTVSVTYNGHTYSYTFSGNSLVLWTPTHQYQNVQVADLVDSASDGCATNLGRSNVVISQVTSDEPEDIAGGGDGNTLKDIVIAPDCKSVQLRAERNGSGNGRVYTITFKVSDGVNTTTVTSKLKIFANSLNVVDDGSAAGYTVNSNCP
jgi:hypothetical protein